ncbi:RNA recognition motif-containing protein [Toxoplasma gondii VEG]|uniref:RNA binding protein, putative n=4 Tax=Toxoplasma gondii TaxID=5811 RepID=B9QR13_TOXGV|nr:RNA recognition motif-containing protein [Toxoplasma gondii VEG]CEL73592.1 TPA: RNA binding protein, putative [Toxoplasma gondii VEG]
MATTSLEEEEYMEGERDEGWGEAGEQREGRLVVAQSRSVSRERELHAASFPVEYDGEDDSPYLQPSERVASKRDEGDPEESDVDHEREERDACYGWESEKEGRPEAPDEGSAASRDEDAEARDDGEGGRQEGREEDVGENEGEEAAEDLEETRRDDEDSLTICGEKGNDSDPIDERKVFVGNTPLAVREPSVERIFGEFGKLSEIKIFKHFLHLTYDDATAATRAVEELNDKEVWGAQIVVEPLRPGAASQRPPGAGAARVVVSRGERDTGAPGVERGRGRGRSGAVAGRGKSAGSVAGARRGGRGRGGQAAGPGGKRLPFRVVCHNLDPRVHWQDLKDFGREAGEVNFTNVLHNQEGVRIGIIEYCSQEDMETALHELDGKRLFDARVEVRREEANASYPSFAEISSSLPPDSLIRPPSGRAPPGPKGASCRARGPPLRASFLDEEDPRAPPTFGGPRGAFPRGRRSSEGRGESAPLPRSARPALPPALNDSLAFGRVSPQREAPAGMPRREKARREKVLAPAAYPAVLPLRAPRRQPGPDEAFELQPFLNGSEACDPRYPGDKHACMEGEEVRPRDSRGSRRDEPSLHTGGFPFWRQGGEDSGARERDSLPSSRERREKDEAESGRPHRRCFYVDCAGTGRVDSAGLGKEKASLNGRLHARGPAEDMSRSHREEEGDARGPKRRRNDFEFMGPPVLPPPTGGPTVILPPPSGPSQTWEFGPGPERLRGGDDGFGTERRRREGDLDLARSRRERDPAPYGASGDKLAWRGRAGKGPAGPKTLDGFPLETVDQGRPNGVFGVGGESKHAEFRYAERGREREGEPHPSSPFRGPRGDPRGLAVVGSVRGGPGGDFRDDEMSAQRRRRPGGRGGAADWRRDPEGPDVFPPFRPHSDRLDHGAEVPCVGRERDRGRGEEDDQRRGDFGRDLDRRAEVPFDDWGQSRREGGLKYEASPHAPLGPRGKRGEKGGGLDFSFPVDKPRHIYAADDGGAPLAPGLEAGPVREREAYLGGGEDERRARRNEHGGPSFLRRDREEDLRRREGRRGEELLHEEVPPAAGARLLGDDRRRSVSLGRRYDVGVDGDRRDRGRPERGYFLGAPHHGREEPGDDGVYRGDRERSAKKPRREEDGSFSREFRGAPGPRGPDRLPVQRADCNMYEARDLGREELFAHPLPGSQYPPQFGNPGLGGSLGRSMRRDEDRRKEEEGLGGPCARGLMPNRGGRGDSAVAKGYSHLHPQGPPCFPAGTGRSGRGLDRDDEGESADGRGRFFERDLEMFRPVRGRECDREFIHLSRQREDMRMMERPYVSREEGRRGGRGADREGDGALGYRDELRHH